MSNSLSFVSRSQKELTPNSYPCPSDDFSLRDTPPQESSERMVPSPQLNNSNSLQINVSGFFAELKRRKVYQVAAAYAVVSWLLIQAASIFLPTFDAPPCVMKAVVVLLALGFVVSVILSWIFDITPQGIKRTADIPLAEAVDIIRQLETQARQEFVRGYLCALLYGGFGDKVKAIDCLKNEYLNGTEIDPTGTSVDAILDGMRADPRFETFLRRPQ
jgi:hypothetical protein